MTLNKQDARVLSTMYSFSSARVPATWVRLVRSVAEGEAAVLLTSLARLSSAGLVETFLEVHLEGRAEAAREKPVARLTLPGLAVAVALRASARRRGASAKAAPRAAA